MSRTDDIAALAAAIQHDLRDGAWERVLCVGQPPALVGDALNLLLREEVIEVDERRRVYRLVPQYARQTTIYDTEG